MYGPTTRKQWSEWVSKPAKQNREQNADQENIPEVSCGLSELVNPTDFQFDPL